MIRALNSAASGMTAQQLNVDTIANNLANANTAGFKMRRAQFEDLIYQSMVQPGAAAGQQTTVPRGFNWDLARGRLRTKSFSRRSFFSHRQSAGRCHSRKRLSANPATFRHHCLHARWLLSVGSERQRCRPQRQRAGAADHHSRQRAEHHDRAGRHRQLHPRRTDGRAKSRTNSTGQFSESRRTE